MFFPNQFCYMLGLLLLFNNVIYQLILLEKGINVMGILANTWTLIADGNIELSIIMTVINTLLACGEWQILFILICFILIFFILEKFFFFFAFFYINFSFEAILVVNTWSNYIDYHPCKCEY